MAKRQGRFVLYCSPLVALVVAGLLVKGRIDGLKRDAELLATTGGEVIQLLKGCAEGLKNGEVERVLACYHPSYTNPQQGFWVEGLRSHRDTIRIYDWREGEPRTFTRADIGEQWSRYLAQVGSLSAVKFRLDSVEEIALPQTLTVRSSLWLRGVTAKGKEFETNARFRLWLRPSAGGWRIHRQRLIRGETVSGERRGFVDVAKDVGLDFRARHNPIFETPEWSPNRFGIIRYGSAGVSTADYDDDGWYDLFFADGAAARMYRNLGRTAGGHLSFRDVTQQVGLADGLAGINVGIFADFDNDGHKDLFLGSFIDAHRLYRNDGDGTFTDVTGSANLGRELAVVASAADYDRDGDLDLYLGRYLDPRVELPTTLFYTRNSLGNRLLRNDGGLRFTDVTEAAGVREGGLTLGVAWGDYDGDGHPDLYVANDFGRNAMLRNRGDGTFEDVSAETGTLDFGFGMSASAGDVDNDGDLDLLVSNVHSAQRWYGQAATLYQYLLTSVRQGTIWQDFGLYREILGYAGAGWRDYGDRMVKGNSLLLNDGQGHFYDAAEEASANPFGWYWGSTFLDYDNDGRLDIYAANGWISGKTKDDL